MLAVTAFVSIIIEQLITHASPTTIPTMKRKMYKIPSSEFIQFISQIYGNLLPYLRAHSSAQILHDKYLRGALCVWG